jgi:hypothetical protein
MLRRNMSGTNGKGFPFVLLSLLYDNLHPGKERASTTHTNTSNQASRNGVRGPTAGFQVVNVALGEHGHTFAHLHTGSRAHSYHLLPH